MHETYLHRCLELARQAAGYTAPNPMVGAVLVHEGCIIGEGWHRQYGGPHAEPNCIASVAEADQPLIPQSTMYVSLEPCAHFGKTPPCADLIVRHRIPRVVIGARDPFVQVDGKGIDKLKAAGVDVTVGVLEEASTELNKRFFTFHTKHRPYIILKWAQTANGFIGNDDHSRLMISNALTNRTVHKWRSEEAAILVGTNTALFDDPRLNTRHWEGPSPIRAVVDMDLRLPASLKLFDGTARTIVFNTKQHAGEGTVQYYQVTRDVSLVHQVANALYQQNILSVLVEGGAQLLQSFIDEGYWDEARIITNETLRVDSGIRAPELGAATLLETTTLENDTIRILKKAEG
ncbi:bifunctional diaminohydroxyphosphoribosylaminopyrimidine deaminase/5-amino-6-(5-phosphoribosylamino)uracil reductase RibD [Paraflavitalea sp. CAU 1676]|uniref:bifunctional diaminohydroxyphosphoribosylaminopyrimidine deaminase/5-amino-6-(5-phosphoribosylamino)uracil reductase RibD n=1 Tax=Paraflavitalea sp. CAU 1676 TaxID=3032598 RepID=UPI0023DB0FB0|nr:bifunctional diaminohydroxyphosphoribosylaminopyrimidine deaminase/5-amino-6-(5-phosphoribosylamino)uracil reductase RibD [Paraflavitalea sp. CAU 1676]MDF2192506.1 bifunctional diaminohydroxyphosphoribosylaminopyrimidine deaminase/5-amino-6-(5-phosphoribosylamino)uracil reductase RibD [Paraflavitalea sp. CAU 1676]